MPRTQNSEMFRPGSPLDWMEITPGTRPPSVLTIFVAGSSRSLVSTTATAPVTLTLRCVPIPMTTTSSIWLPSRRVILTSAAEVMICSAVSYPMNDTASVLYSLAVSLNRPSELVMEPMPGSSLI